MPNLLNQSNHEEFESNSALQIINHKERRSRRRAEKVRRSSISQEGAKFSQHCAKFPSCATVHAAFDILTFLCPFLISSHFVPVLVNYFCSFW